MSTQALLFLILPVAIAVLLNYALHLAWPREAEQEKTARPRKFGAPDPTDKASALVDRPTMARHAARREERQLPENVVPEQSPTAFVVPEDFNIDEFRSAHDRA